ncbi:hypothetical protein [Kosakonia arachidis]|uniref:hypothetical protein n=1 Tax=Kosakonia arachidis TaxID=551989 RepID=UPI001113B8C9|nr:hypothetical protein [Kosakonia arachidis]
MRMEEAPLETPLTDPTDIALIAFGVFRILRTGRALFETSSRTALTTNPGGGFQIGVSARNLKITKTVVMRMGDPDRYVPLQIMEKANRYGTRSPESVR